MAKKFDLSMWLLEELIEAYSKARVGGKRKSANEHRVEMNEIENLGILRDTILAQKYKPSRGVAFMIQDPKLREVFAATFIDRIVHHFLCKYAFRWWESRLWRGSYSCRKGKGTYHGIIDLQKNMRRVSCDGKYETVVVKLDLRGYFMSLNRKKLYKRVLWGLNQQFPDGGAKYRILKYLWKQVIFDDPTDGVRVKGDEKTWNKLPPSKSLFYQPKGQGIVIGNLTSQLLSNIFLDLLDRFIVFELGYQAYCRYVDDFCFVIRLKDLDRFLSVDMPRIIEYLAKMGLTLHPDKQEIVNIKDGVEFIGAKVYLDHIVPGKRILKNFADKVYAFETQGIGDPASIGVYDGFLSKYSSEKAIRKIYGGVGWKYKDSENRDF